MENEVKRGLAEPAEARAFLRVSSTTLWRAQQVGALVPVRLGRHLRYRWSDLERIASEGLPSLAGVKRGGKQ
ncbi:MAG: helix-turn-helix domain-containing protein [Burkholderiales bacterium]|nr:helix-turn-helix domain-containing protein [Burkholderiales bacterium]